MARGLNKKDFKKEINDRGKTDELFRLVIEAAPDAFVIINQTGRIILVNSQTEKLFGYKRQELLDQAVEILVPERFRPKHPGYRTGFFGAPRARAMGAGLDLWGLRKDGTEFPVEISLSPLETEEGLLATAAIRDITERKRTEASLRRMATVVTDSNDAITIQDLDGKISAWNRGAERMYGYTESEARAMNVQETIPAAKRQEALEFMKRVQEEEITSFETQRLTKDGRTLDVWLTVTKLVDEAGKSIGIATTERNITERKRTEASLRRMATVVTDSNDAITIQDLDGKISAWNRGAERMYGYTESEARAMNVQETIPAAKRQEALEFMKRVQEEEITSFETQRLTKDGRTLDVWLTVTKLVDEAGKSIGIATTERNITERKRTEEEIRALNRTLEKRVIERTEKLQHEATVRQRAEELLIEEKKNLEKVNLELDSFVYTASHDLRAPLRGISSYATFLEEDYNDKFDEKGKDYLNGIRKAAGRMDELIEGLLTLSRLSRIKNPYQEVNFKDLLDSILQRIEFDIRELKVDLRIQTNLPTITCDRIKIGEVLLNLVNNAVKFSSKNNKEHPKVEIGYHDKKKAHEFYVKDNGIGIDPQYHQRIFGLFEHLHLADQFEGVGLGLNIVKRVIEDQGGKVWVESALGKGATFYFTIPRSLKT